MTEQTMFDRLRAPFPPERVSWRVGPSTKDGTRGMALAYIDARDAMDRLDDVCGPANWQCRYPPRTNGETVCEIGIKVGDEWIWKADGAGETKVEAEKGALSVAFKRAAVRWGIGRYLYDVDGGWVDTKGHGESKRIPPHELAALKAKLAGAPPPPRNLRQAQDRLAMDLMAELRQQGTAEDLAAAMKAPEFERRFVALDERNKVSVRTAYAARMRELKASVAA